MIRHTFTADDKWKIVVYYDVDYNLFSYIKHELQLLSISEQLISRVYSEMKSFRAKAVTISSYENRTSVVLFNHHSNIHDYVNSIIHESEHVKQAMLDYYNIIDAGEPPAYTIGFVAAKMLQKFWLLN